MPEAKAIAWDFSRDEILIIQRGQRSLPISSRLVGYRCALIGLVFRLHEPSWLDCYKKKKQITCSVHFSYESDFVCLPSPIFPFLNIFCLNRPYSSRRCRNCVPCGIWLLLLDCAPPLHILYRSPYSSTTFHLSLALFRSTSNQPSVVIATQNHTFLDPSYFFTFFLIFNHLLPWNTLYCILEQIVLHFVIVVVIIPFHFLVPPFSFRLAIPGSRCTLAEGCHRMYYHFCEKMSSITMFQIVRTLSWHTSLFANNPKQPSLSELKSTARDICHQILEIVITSPMTVETTTPTWRFVRVCCQTK